MVYNDLALALNLRPAEVRPICMGAVNGCPMYQPYTPEEIAAGDRSLQDKIANVAIARQVVLKKSMGKRGVFGTLDCPFCKEHTLRWSVADFDAEKTAGKCANGCTEWRDYESKS